MKSVSFMDVHMFKRSFLFVLGILAVLSAAAPRAAHAQTTGLFFDSQAGDCVGGGTSLVVHPASTRRSAPQTSPAYGTAISLETPGHRRSFTGPSISRRPATPPVAGVYESARRAAFTKFVGLDVFGDGRGCNELTGRFVVLEAEYGSDGSVLALRRRLRTALRRRRRGALWGGPLQLDGVDPRAVRRRVSDPPVDGDAARRTARFRASASTADPRSAQCVVTLSAPATASIDAVPDPGFLFAGWTGGCSGGPRSTVRINMPRTCSAAFTPIVPASPRTLAVITGAASSVVRGVPVVASLANSTWTLEPNSNGFRVQVDYVGPVRSKLRLVHHQPADGPDLRNRPGVPGSLVRRRHARRGSGAWPMAAACDAGVDLHRARLGRWIRRRAGAVFHRFPAGVRRGTVRHAAVRLVLRVRPPRRRRTPPLHFTAVRDQAGIVSHSADQLFNVSPSGPLTLHGR